jgi:uncharacterized protein YutE (UPF0331/DUF86 family)
LQYEAQHRAAWQALRDRGTSSWRLTLALKFYSVAGLVLAIIGSGYLVFELLSVSLRKSELLALTASVAGLLMAVLSWALLGFRREMLQRRTDRVHEYLLVGRFIQAWAAFEESARSRLGEDEMGTSRSVRGVLEALKRKRLLEPTDFVRVEELLQLRNAIVHTGVNIPREEIENGYQILLHYAEKLSEVEPQVSVAAPTHA